MTIRSLLVLLVWLYVAAIYEARPHAQPSKVDVCHYDDALQKYALIQTSVSGWQGGHSKHGKDCCMYDQVDVCPTSRRCDAPGAAIVMALDRTANTCTPTCASNPTLANGAFSCIGTAVGKSCVGSCSFGYAGQPAATCTAAGSYSIVGTCDAAPDVDGCAPPTGYPCSGCDTKTNPGAFDRNCLDDPGLGPGFTCAEACGTGYTFDASTKCCKDTNGCIGNSCSNDLHSTGACDDVPAPGTGYSCVCRDAYALAADGTCAVTISGTIAIKGRHATGFCCDDFYSNIDRLVCDRVGIGAWEKFSVEAVGPNKVALRGGNRRLYCSEGVNQVVNCNKSVRGDSETFTVEYLGGDQIALRGGQSSNYCSDRPTSVICDTNVLGSSQTYDVVRNAV